MAELTTHSKKSESVLDERIRTALSSAKMALWELDLKTMHASWSGKVTPHFFEFAQSIDGSLENYLEKVHPEDVEELKNFVMSAKFGEDFVKKHRVMWQDGTYHWLEGVGKVVIDKNGARLTGTVQDVTEKINLEREREDWKVRHEMVAHAAGVIVYDYDIRSGNILWSGNVQEVLGFTPKEMGNIDRWLELIHPDDRDRALEQLKEAQISSSSYEVQYRFLNNKNEYRHIYDRGDFLAKKGKAYRMLGMMNDVTAWHKSQDALNESENRFNSMIHNMNVGIGLYDKNSNPLVANNAAYELLGMSEDQFMGMAALDEEWNVIHNDGTAFGSESFPIPRSVKERKPIRHVVMGVYRPAYSDRVWLTVDAEPIFDTDGDLIHVICTFSDISRVKRVEEELEKKNQQLEHSSSELLRKNHRLLEFAQIVSHNLRSPMSNISALIDLYEKGDDQNKVDTINYIKKISKNALTTIEDLNEVLKIQQAERIDLQKVVWSDVLKGVRNLLKASIADRNTLIKTDFDEAPCVHYAPVYGESILLNLLSNSLKYSHPKRKPKVTIKTKWSKKDIVMIFEDNGLGIDLKKYGRDIFRFGKTFHEHEDSKGIGLFLIKNQIQTMGDNIKVESEPGKGTRFILTFKNQHGKV